MSDLLSFDFSKNQSVRIVMRDQQPWFVAADVCHVLDVAETHRAAARLDDDEKDSHTVTTLGGPQEMTVINESGLYSLILTSRKPSAKKFKKWVTSEVLPSIRKTGGYEVPGRAGRQRNGRAALSNSAVLTITEMATAGASNAAIARFVGCAPSTVDAILRGRRRADVTGLPDITRSRSLISIQTAVLPQPVQTFGGWEAGQARAAEWLSFAATDPVQARLNLTNWIIDCLPENSPARPFVSGFIDGVGEGLAPIVRQETMTPVDDNAPKPRTRKPKRVMKPAPDSVQPQTHHEHAAFYLKQAISILHELDEAMPADVVDSLRMADAHLKNCRYLETQELAARWRMKTGSLDNMRSNGEGPAFMRPGGKTRGKVLYAIAEVEKFEAENTFGNT